MALPVNEYLNAIIIIQLSIKVPLLGGIKRGAPHMRVPVSGTRFPEQPHLFSSCNSSLPRCLMGIQYTAATALLYRPH
jgi:hypothetical protein